MALNKMSSIEYSVVIPVFGAEESLLKLHENIRLFFEGRATYEVIYIDDFSMDNSWNILKEIKQKYDNTTVIRLSKNFGQHAATICGFKYAKGNFVITLDDDMEVHPNEIEKLIEAQKNKNTDLTYGVYAKLNQPAFRNILTNLYKLISKIEGPQKGKGSSFRLLKRDLAQKLALNHKQFVFIDELCLWYTNKIAFVDVVANKDFSLKQRYKIGGLLKITTNVIMFSSTFPLKLVTQVGLILFTVNFIIGVYFIIKKFLFKIEVMGYTSLIVSILFSTGLIIFCIGILAQYLAQTLRSVNNAPCYNEDEIIC